jgi:glutamate-1-semialdehyde 2,1-aminomutase
MTINETYRSRHSGSAERYRQTLTTFPSGITHDARHMQPFPLFVERSLGSRKWDVDGNELIDYWTGHGALLLGHSHPEIVAAVQKQIALGVHYGAEHELSYRWAKLIQQLFPSAERLRFTASGTEATMLAVRLARAYTGRRTIVRFRTHFHGWNDALSHGMEYDLTPPPGLLSEVADATEVILPDIEIVNDLLGERDDIAAIILEPSGASYGTVPLSDQFLQQLRSLTQQHNVLLICDEVVTGFRVTPGGVQQRAGIKPDLTTFAKILAGGLPGGAVGGAEEVMRHLEFGDAEWNQTRKVRHNGTFNANPLSAAAGIVMLEHVATGKPGAQANALGTQLISGLNSIIRDRSLRGWAAYGDGSIFHIVVGASTNSEPGVISPDTPLPELKRGGNMTLLGQLRQGLNNHGVDLMRGHSGFLSSAHTEEDIAQTLAAFSATLDDMAAEGHIKS